MQELFEQASILFEEEEEILKFSHAEELRSLARKVGTALSFPLNTFGVGESNVLIRVDC